MQVNLYLFLQIWGGAFDNVEYMTRRRMWYDGTIMKYCIRLQSLTAQINLSMD